MNRFFTRTELADAYRLPQHVQDQLLAEFATVEKDDQGEPLLLEAHVEAWLTVRYSAPSWRAPTTEDVKKARPCTTATKANEDQGAFVTVAEARQRFLNGQMSKKWWYQMAQTGLIAHHRVGETILFRTEDIEKYIAESRRAEQVTPVEAQPAVPLPVPLATRRPGKKAREDGFYRIFAKR